MILNFSDPDGDPIAFESSTIVGLAVGVSDARDGPVTVTVVATVGGTFKVADPYAEVHRAWTQARALTPEQSGWKFHDVVKGSTG